MQDADRLEALGVIGTFRCIATGVRFGAQFFDAADPWAVNRPLDDKRFSVDHFFTKLLKLPETFQAVEGRAEAERRVRDHAFAARGATGGIDLAASGGWKRENGLARHPEEAGAKRSATEGSLSLEAVSTALARKRSLVACSFSGQARRRFALLL